MGGGVVGKKKRPNLKEYLQALPARKTKCALCRLPEAAEVNQARAAAMSGGKPVTLRQLHGYLTDVCGRTIGLNAVEHHFRGDHHLRANEPIEE